MKNKPTLAAIMAELSSTREYRDKIKQIRKLALDTKTSRRSVLMQMPEQKTIDVLLLDGFSVTKDTTSNSELTYIVTW